MLKLRQALFTIPFLLAVSISPVTAQPNRNAHFNNGMRDGARGGRYYDPHYDERHHRDEGGIGPGKGALIGGAGGAALGAVFGGGLKGALVGGAAGAGIGAIVGQVHQSNERHDEYYRHHR